VTINPGTADSRTSAGRVTGFSFTRSPGTMNSLEVLIGSV
jgi:hypothetical protein